jgi:SAM-dependent methyltransferase
MSRTPETDPWKRIRGAVVDSDRLLRAVASGRQRNTAPAYRRVELRYVDVKGALRLQLTSYDETQAFTRNEAASEAGSILDDLFTVGYANWHVETVEETLQVRVTKKGRPLLHVAPKAAGNETAPPRAHDRSKQRRLLADDPVFRVLGVANADGTIKPSRMAKFRQVQDLLAIIDPLIDDAVALGPGSELGPDRPLRLVDLGCGNAYLTFAALRYLTTERGIAATMTGVDVKPQALQHNTEVTRRLGLSASVRFVEGSIANAEVDEPPDLVLALHACDTATDEALARAVRWRAPVVVAAPCCHHDISRQLSAGTVPASYRLVTRHGILRERLADVLTDGLRAALMRLVGYRVDVVEFVDSRHTPRNALIRAVRTGAVADEPTWRAYRELTREWGVTPALEGMLAEVLPGVW